MRNIILICFILISFFNSSACAQIIKDKQYCNNPKDFKTAQLPSNVLEKFRKEIFDLIDKANIDFQDADRTRRKAIEYGYSFQKMVSGDFSFEEPPQFLVDLGNEVCKSLGEEEQKFSNFIISIYEPGFYIEPHYDTDKDDLLKYNFYFGEKVFGVIIEADPTGGLYLIRYTGSSPQPPLDFGPRIRINEKPGIVFVLKGKYRYKPYYHGVSEILKSRISVTFRYVNFS